MLPSSSRLESYFIISGSFRVSYSDISGCCRVLPDSLHIPSFLDIAVFPVRAFPDFYVFFPVRFIFHHFLMFPTSCSDISRFARLLPDSVYSTSSRFVSCSFISGYFRLVYSEFSGCFCLLPDSLLFPSFPDVSSA